MEIKEKINHLIEENKKIEATKENLITAHLEQINKVIEDKIIQLKDELREGAIVEVCGEEYKVLNQGIAKNNKYIKMLEDIGEEEEFINVLKDIMPEKVQEMPLEEDLKEPVENVDNNNKTSETTIQGTNQDILDGKLN